MKNLFFFNQRSNAAAQATECAYTTGQKFGVPPTPTSTFGRLATYIGLVLVMLVTLGVGEMKAYNYQTSHGGFWKDGGLELKWTNNASSTTTTINNNSISGNSIGTITTALTLSKITVKGWNTDHYANICEATVYFDLYKGSTKIESWSDNTDSKSWSSNNCTFTMNSNKDVLALTTGPGSYTIRVYAKITGADTDDYYGDVSYKGCSTTTWWYNNETTNGYYSVTFTIPSKNLTVAGAANGNTVSGSVEGITKGTAYTITASPTSGYAFSSWSATSGGSSITIASTSSATTTVTFNNYSNNATVTATFVAEETHDVTISYKCGSTTIKTATTESAVGVSTPRSITAPDIDGYTFSSWTKGSGITITSGSTSTASISFTSGASGNTLQANYTAKTKVRLYYTNPGGFSTPKAYFYSNAGSESDSGWPGIAMTSTTECGDTYYYVEYYKEDHLYWDRVIFNDNGNSSTQTSNITFSNTTNNGQYNNAPASKSGAGSWSSTAPQKWALSGSMNSWSTSANMFTCDDGTLSLDISLSANTDYNFKIVNVPADKWYGTASATKITYVNQATAQTISQENGADNAYQTMRSAAAGTYTFTWNPTNKKVKVSYPTSYKVELEVGTVKGNKNTLKIYHTSPVAGNEVTSGNYVAAGTKVYFWAASAAAEATICKPGYEWWGFYNNAAGTGSTTPEKYTRADVSMFNVDPITSDMNVYAVFGEKDYTVKIVNNGNGDVYEGGSIVTATTAHVATASNTLTATPQTGYYFTGWDQFSDSLTITNSSSASTTIKIKDTKLGNNARLRANYSPQWSVLGSGAFGGWEAYSTNLFTGYTKVSTKDVGYKTITLAANTNYEIKVYDRANSTLYGGSANQTIDYAHSGAGNEYTIATTSSPKSVFIQSAAGGTYTLNWNLTDKKIAVVYPTSWYITTGVNDALGGSFTAVDNSSNNVYGGKFVANSANVVFTATANTGYDFAGWYSNSTCTTAYTAGTGVAFSGEGNTVMTLSGITADKTIYAKFTAKTYNVALDMQTSAEGYGSGSNRNETVTYNATLTTVGSLPTAANGYAFMGFYSGTGGKGTQFINASGTWATSVTDTISDSKWVLDAGATLYAYYKKAEITELTVSPSTVGTGEEVTATPTIYPTPTGSYKVCWKILRNNGNVLTEDGFSEGDDDAVTFDAPTVSGTYKVACVLRTGSACNAGTVLDSVVTDFVVAGVHTVAIRYQDSDGRTLAATAEVTAYPLEWSEDITAPSITGYTFTRWDAGDGVSIKNGASTATTSTNTTIKIKASYDGQLTAVYSKKKMIYFNNTLGWSDVYVYFYNSNKYWSSADNCGSGAKKDQAFDGDNKPYYQEEHGHMTNITGTNIWYFDYTAESIPDRTNITFTKDNQHTYQWFYNTEVVRVCDAPFNGTTLPMYVPLSEPTETKNGSTYYTKGYWMNYSENTGYWLKIFDGTGGGASQVMSIPFEFTGDLTMPMSVTAELEGGRTYGFKIYRNDATWWGNNGTMKINASGDTGQTVWEFTTGKNNCGLTTSVAGDYTFTLTYGAKSGTYYYLVGVHYPVAKNDYRIMYKDLATWSQGSAHTSAWGHPSRAIHKEDGAKDIVSFYVSKATGASATMKFQYASAISNEGVVTWTDVTSGSIDLSGIEESGVYNFHLTQADGAISVEKIEKYDGNYYIRTDCAGTTKWDNYRADDHKMSYSEFSMSSANSFGEKYSHYYTHWCPRGTNVKFVVANDYSSCVSDTLIRDVGDPYSNIYENDGGGRADGELKAETYSGTTPSSDPTADKYSANIRFMYNESTNKISRAYLSSSTNQSRKFLVLKGEDEFWNGDGTNLSGTGESHANHEAIFVDDEDWIYEREIKVTPGTLFKLYACYAQSSPDASTAQYFRGAYDGGDFTEDVNSIVLIGGTGSASKTRIVYDFKSNRLMAAYQPEEGDIEGVQAIKADIMLVREHQEAGQQLTFKDESSKLTEVKTVYGVMRFNRWTLNNRANPEDHDKDHSDTDGDITTYHPLLDAGSQKSTSERGLYWISFPFDVNLNEVFGFGTYGRHWAIMYYDGAARAEKGYWTDSEGFWEFYEDRKDVTLEAGKGYVLGLDLDLMQANDRTFWANEIQQVELFFPSTASAGTIQQTNTTVSVPSHECTIDRTGNNGSDISKNRKIADSHWNVIGVPSYANYGTTLSDGSNTVTWHAPNTNSLPFLYEWNMADNSYTPQTGSTYSFKAMHAYMVQYQGTLVWSLASATPASPMARRANELPQQNIEFRLELQQNNKMTDQTFVKLSDNEEVSANFAFDEDMMKEFNKGKANIYTMVEGYIPTAGNTLPMLEQTTVVPVGVKIATNGDYTFSIPDGTSGVGVTLIDTENNIRTNLSAVDYTVSLESGQNDNRFVLEISPIQHIATEIETSDIGDQKSDVRKLLIDGLLYIVRDGKVYDARGARIE